METTAYFRDRVLAVRPYLPGYWEQWCRRALAEPVERDVEDSGRVRHWIRVEHPDYGSRALRVVTLKDGRTIHTMFFDRAARVRWDQEARQ